MNREASHLSHAVDVLAADSALLDHVSISAASAADSPFLHAVYRCPA